MPSAALAPIHAPTPPVPGAPDLDRAVADMRAFLVRVRPQSQAESLRMLRNAYPQAPLSVRVAACGLA